MYSKTSYNAVFPRRVPGINEPPAAMRSSNVFMRSGFGGNFICASFENSENTYKNKNKKVGQMRPHKLV
jgi:hypothetical protein